MVRDGRLDLQGYVPPGVTDHGHLRDMTATTNLLLAGGGDDAMARDLSFSGTSPTVGGTTSENPQPTVSPAGSGDAGSPSANGGVAGGDASGGGPGGGSGSDGGADSGTGTGGAGSGSGGGGEGSGGGGEAPGGSLPFTGFAAGALAAIGSALLAAGGGVRRTLRRR